jgi:hypothetical protein
MLSVNSHDLGVSKILGSNVIQHDSEKEKDTSVRVRGITTFDSEVHWQLENQEDTIRLISEDVIVDDEEIIDG